MALDYNDVKRWKRDLMLQDKEFLSGHGRLESVEFHTAKRIYLKGIEDGGEVVARMDEAIALLNERGPGYTQVLQIVEEVRAKVVFA